MKIEKINDNQIRCTLTQEDLINRELKLSELAYGTDKAKQLFHDMMQQASNDFGFEAENIPLMIEAIPLKAESIMLIITKVTDPEELDTRFSKFSPALLAKEFQDDNDATETTDTNNDEILDLFKKLHATNSSENDNLVGDTTLEIIDDFDDDDTDSTPKKTITINSVTRKKQAKNLIKIYSFDSFSKLLYATSLLDQTLILSSSLFKDEKKETYILFLESAPLARKDFIHLFHTLAEYSETLNLSPTVAYAYYNEHCTSLLPKNAIQSLAKMM